MTTGTAPSLPAIYSGVVRYLLFYVLPFALLLYGLIDCARAESYELAGLPRPVWYVLIVVPVIGPLAWIAVSRTQRYGRGNQPSTPPPLPPDEDPEFLRWLAQQEKRRKRDNPDA